MSASYPCSMLSPSLPLFSLLLSHNSINCSLIVWLLQNYRGLILHTTNGSITRLREVWRRHTGWWLHWEEGERVRAEERCGREGRETKKSCSTAAEKWWSRAGGNSPGVERSSRCSATFLLTQLMCRCCCCCCTSPSLSVSYMLRNPIKQSRLPSPNQGQPALEQRAALGGNTFSSSASLHHITPHARTTTTNAAFASFRVQSTF